MKDDHNIGWKGIRKSVQWKTIFKSNPFICSLVISIGISISVIYSHNVIPFLVKLVDITIAILPNLLGFNLGGYALIIGFGNNSMLESMTEKQKSGLSLLQTISGIFAFVLCVQALALAVAFIMYLCLQISTTKLTVLFFDENVLNTIIHVLNYICLFILLLLTTYSIFLAPIMVKNVFTFGQLVHFKFVQEREKKSNPDSDE